MKKYISLGDLLLDFRVRSTISQADLAAKFNVDIRTIIRWEKNETLLKPDKEEEMVDITFIPYQVIRNLNAPVSIPTYYDFDLRKYSLSTISNDLPDASWLKTKMDANTDRLRAIKHESDIDLIIRSSSIQKQIVKPISRELMKRAMELLPAMNIILFDTSGYYSGHSVFFPLAKEAYEKIRNRTMKEEDIQPSDLIDYQKDPNPVFYAYDINSDCNDNLYFIASGLMQFFKGYQKEYTYASYTSRHDSFALNEQLGIQIVWEDHDLQDTIKSKAAPRLYEGNFRAFFKD